MALSLWLQNTHKLQVLIDGKPPKEAFINSPRKELSQKKNPYEFYLYYVWILKTGKVVSDLSVTYKLLTIGEYFLWVLKVDKPDAYCTFFWVNIKFQDWRKQSEGWLSLVLSQDGTHCDTVHVFVSSNLNVNFLT